MANTTFPFKYRNSYEFFCKVKYNFYKWSFSIKRKLTRKFLRIMILKICLRICFKMLFRLCLNFKFHGLGLC